MNALAYDVKEAALACHVSEVTIYSWINHGGLKAKKAGTKLLILADELQRCLAALPDARN